MSEERTECRDCGHTLYPYYAKCPKCEGDRNRREVDLLADVIREFKRSAYEPIEQEREQQLVELLYRYRHPDPKGLIDWVANERASEVKRDTKGNRR